MTHDQARAILEDAEATIAVDEEGARRRSAVR